MAIKLKKPHKYREVLLHPFKGKLINLKGKDIERKFINKYTGKEEVEIIKGASQEQLIELYEDNKHLLESIDDEIKFKANPLKSTKDKTGK